MVNGALGAENRSTIRRMHTPRTSKASNARKCSLRSL